MLGLWSEITKMIAEYLFYIFKLKNKFRVSTTQHFKMHNVKKTTIIDLIDDKTVLERGE